MKYKHITYGISTYVDRALWEEWVLRYFRPVFHYWGNPEIFHA